MARTGAKIWCGEPARRGSTTEVVAVPPLSAALAISMPPAIGLPSKNSTVPVGVGWLTRRSPWR